MKSVMRVSATALMLAFILSAHSASCFQVGTFSHKAMAKPALLSGRHSTIHNRLHQSRVLNVRGGAQSTALHAIMVDYLALVNNFYQTSPYVAAALTCGTKASAADYVAQRRQTKANDNISTAASKLDTARNVAFLLYGAVYQGMAQEYIYNHLYPLWFGAGTGVGVVLKKVLFDLLIQTTLFTLPIAYLTKAAIFRHSPKQGLKRYWHDVMENGLLSKYFLLWGPVQCVTFSLTPEHLRVSFIAVVSFFWLIILSTVSARPAANKASKVVAAKQDVKVRETNLVDG